MTLRARRRIEDPSRQIRSQARQIRGEGTQILVDLLRIILAHDVVGKRRHDAAGPADLMQEGVHGEPGSGKRGADPAPAARAMASEASAGDVEPFP